MVAHLLQITKTLGGGTGIRKDAFSGVLRGGGSVVILRNYWSVRKAKKALGHISWQ